jgi:hypothetical protein
MKPCRTVWFLTVGVTVAALGTTSIAAAQAAARDDGQWVVPRTEHGYPDLQGNWTNATLTPLERPAGQGPTMSWEEVDLLEGRTQRQRELAFQPSDPNRPAPPVGGDGSTGAAGGVGGYNSVYIERGDRVAIVNGEPRTSIIVDPPDGLVPALTEEARQRQAQARMGLAGMGQYDNPENRPLAERCIVSFGSNMGPPMLPNYFYNNNYTIVQTADHVMIMTEMIHDARIIRLGDGPRLPDHVRPWFGDSWGYYEDDTLVIETTNFHPNQRVRGVPSDNTRVIERLTRVDEETILYEFTVDDPTTFAAPWTGQLPFNRMDARIYEYACHEGNYSLSNVLSGARYQERLAAGEADSQ